MSREVIADMLATHRYTPLECSCGWRLPESLLAPKETYEVHQKNVRASYLHIADVLLAALPPPRGGDAAEEELGALLERLSIQGGVSFMRWESDGRTHADSAEFEVSGATPLAALRALDAALAEQRDDGEAG